MTPFIFLILVPLLLFGSAFLVGSHIGNSWAQRVFLGRKIVKFKTYWGKWERRNVQVDPVGRMFVYEYPSIKMDKYYLDKHGPEKIRWISKPPVETTKVTIR